MSVVTLNDDGFIENQPGGRVHLLTFGEAGALSGQLRQVLQRTIEEGLEPSEGTNTAQRSTCASCSVTTWPLRLAW